MRARSALVLALFLLLGAVLAAEPPGVPGRIESVTLYRGQALVTRVVPVDAPPGRVELTVSDLPERIEGETLFAEASPGLDVRAVRYRTRAVGEEPREVVRQLDAEIEGVETKIAHNRRMSELVQQRLQYLDKLEGFVAPTATVEMSKGVLNAETLKGVTLFNFDQRKAAAEESLTLASGAKDLGKQLELLRRKRAEVAAGVSKTVREALLFLEKTQPGALTVKLSYLTDGAGWLPSYNFRADKDGKEVRVEYNALIHQQTGEDWTGVALTLSTASPALAAEGPGMAPFRVVLSREAPNQPQSGSRNAAELSNMISSGKQERVVAIQGQQKALDRLSNTDKAWGLNDVANRLQVIELDNGGEVLKQAFQMQATVAEGVSVSYLLGHPVSLASRPDQQLVRVGEPKLAGHLYYVASPVLTSYVYREAELTNDSMDAMLAGPVNAYLDGRFVGRGEIPSVAKGETFVVGFGADGQLRARRELVDKTESLQGGNREQNYKYRLVIENYKDTEAKVRVKDRIPVAQRDTDIRVTLGTSSETLSEDKVYLRIERPKGILRWEVTVPAKSAGEKAKLVEYGYRLEFDRNMRLAVPGSGQPGAPSPELRREFEDLQEQRSKF